MASSIAVTIEEELKPPDHKSTRSPKVKSSSLKHKNRFPSETVKQSEESLRQLLVDFENGRLNAFGKFIQLIIIHSVPILPTNAHRSFRHAPEDEGHQGNARETDHKAL